MRRMAFAAVVLALLAGPALHAQTTFTKSFETASTAGWSDPVNPTTNFVLVSGDSTPADVPAFSPPPNTATGFNGTSWLRFGRTDNSNNGVCLAIYDAVGQGDLPAAPTDHTVEALVFVKVDATERYQVGITGRYTLALGNFPFELFYSNNTGTQPNGYGTRGGGSTTNYGAFGGVTETANRWVRMRIQFAGLVANVGVDRDLDGVYELTQDGIALTATDGLPGCFSVLNNPSTGDGLPNQFVYFDELSVSVPAAGVTEWMLM